MYVSPDAPTITITKAEVDRLIDRNPGWMATVWARLPKAYNTYTVTVYQVAGSGLAEQVNRLRASY